MGRIARRSRGRTPREHARLRFLAAAWLAATSAGAAAPMVSALAPPSGSPHAVGRQPFAVRFASPVQLGSGSISIRRSSDGSVLETIPVPSARVSAGGGVLLADFEAGIGEFAYGWGAATRSRDSARAHSGSGSLKVTTTSTWQQVEDYFGSHPQDWSGQDSIACWVYTELSGAYLENDFRTGAGAAGRLQTTQTYTNLAQNSWTRVSFPVARISDPAWVASWALNFSTAGTYWIDDVQLVRNGSSALSFMGSVLFANDSDYYVAIDRGVVADSASGAAWGGIGDATTWLLHADRTPASIALSSSSVPEGQPTGTVVGSLSATDPDSSETFSFSLPSGQADNAAFSVSGGNLVTAAILDASVKASYSVVVQVSDLRGGVLQRTFPISVQTRPHRLNWDVSKSAGFQAGNGTWGMDNFWSTDGTNLGSWPGSGRAAEFAGADGSWNVSLNGSISADSLVFTASGYQVNGGTIYLTGSSPTIVANADATIGSTLSGAATKAGAATLTLTSGATNCRSFTHKAGTTVAGASGALGPGTVTVAGTGTIALVGGVTESNQMIVNSCAAGMGNAVLTTTGGTATWSGPVTLNATCADGGLFAGPSDTGSSLRVTGQVNASNGAKPIHRSGTVVYTGGGNAAEFVLVNGTARLGANNGLPTGALWNQNQTGYGSTLDLHGYDQAFLALTSPSNSGSTIANTQSNTSTLTLTGSIDTTYGGVLAGNLAIAKTGSGRQTLAGTSTQTGSTQINQGTLVLAGGHVWSGTGTDNLLVANGGQSAVLKVAAGTHGYNGLRIGSSDNATGAAWFAGGTTTLGAGTGTDNLSVGHSNGSSGYLAVSGGALSAREIDVGGVSGGSGVVDLTGGVLTASDRLAISRGSANSGTLNILGGSLVAQGPAAMGWATSSGAVSALNVGGGTDSAWYLGSGASTPGTGWSDGKGIGMSVGSASSSYSFVNILPKGTVAVSEITAYGATPVSVVNFDGGTLRATVPNAGRSFLSNPALTGLLVHSGGARIDDAGTLVAVSRPLADPGGSGVASVTVNYTGSGYTAPPQISFKGGSGIPATARAVMADDGTGTGTMKVAAVVVTHRGAYASAPTGIAFAGGGPGSAANATFSMSANASGGLEKVGSGTLVLQAANTYAGTTSVRSGTLVVDGSTHASSQVVVSSGAVLSGKGTVGGPISVQGGAVVPGSRDSVGLLSAGDLDLSSTDASSIRIRMRGTTRPGIDYDRLSLGGTLLLGGRSNLDVDLSGMAAPGTASGVVLADSVSGTFASLSVRNNPSNWKVSAVYRSGSVDVVASSTPPSFAIGPSISVREDTGTVSVAGWATSISSGSGSSGQTPGFRVSADRPDLFSTQPSVSPTGTLSFRPARDSSGTSTIRLRLGASGSSDSSAIDSFVVAVRAVNDAPSFVPGGDRRVLWNSGPDTTAGWATSISAGPADERNQKVGFAISNDNPSLFSAQPSLSAAGTLSFTPASGRYGTALARVRLGDDGGTADRGIDSSAADTFRIEIQPTLSFRLRPDTLRMREGDTARFAAWAQSSGGRDSARLDGSQFEWSASASLGSLSESGLVSAARKGTALVVARGFGSVDTAVLVVSVLDTTLPAATDSVRVRAGHGIRIAVPPHASPARLAVSTSDTSLRSRGISGADSGVLLVSEGTSPVRVVLPWSLVPSPARSGRGAPSVFRIDSTGHLRLVASSALADSSTAFDATGTSTWWLGYDTVPPRVELAPGSDSMAGASLPLAWTISDNVAETGLWSCVRQAGSAAARCSLLVVGDSARDTFTLPRRMVPLGGGVWMEARDSRSTVATAGRDVVVRLDTLRAAWSRAEDLYELLSLPYVSGAGSAEAAFAEQWGGNDVHRWRAWGADSGRFVEILPGTALDASGRGFWVRTRRESLVPWCAGRWTHPVSVPRALVLQPGWNAVGNPLGFQVSWRQIRGLSGLDSLAVVGPYLFDGPSQGWSLPDTTLAWPAWKGLAILNSTGRAVTLQVPSLPDAPAAARSAGTAPALPDIRIRPSQGSATAPSVWIGRAAAARTLPLPPSPGTGIRAWLQTASSPTANLLDLRPASDTSPWILRVSGLSPRCPLVLSTLGAPADSASAPWIHDDKSGRWVAASASTEFAVGEEVERTFRIRLGAPGPSAASRAFGFDTRGRTLVWSLPDGMGRARVRVEARDPRGRLLSTLVDEEMDPGTYSRPIEVHSPTGQFLLTLSAGGERMTLQRFFLR